MTRNLKAMGLALLAVLAVAALGAQSASAVVNHEFTSDSSNGKTILTGTTESAPNAHETFTLTGVPVKCTDVSYRGTTTSASVDFVSVVPDFSKAHCELAGNTVTIDNTGCTYKFGSDTNQNTTHFAVGVEHANVSIVCGHTAHIVVTGQSCDVTVSDTSGPAGVTVNQNLPGLRYTVLPNHSGDKAGLTVTATVRTISAKTSGVNCPALGLGNPGTHINGTYAGRAITTCYEDTVMQTDPHSAFTTEGSLVNCGLSTP